MKKIAIFLTLIIALCACANFSGCKKESSARTTYNLNCTLDGNTLYGTETVNFYNDTENSFTELKFNLFGNAFRKGAKYSPIAPEHTSRAYPNGISYGDMKINSVKSLNKDMEFSIGGQDENILTVKLFEEVFPNERVSLSIDYVLNLANVIARTGVNAKTVNLANFYPILCATDNGSFYECVYYAIGDPFYSDCADYTVTLTANKDLVVASSGRLCSENISTDTATRTYKINNARSFAFVLSKNFKVATDNSTGVAVNYYYYDDASPEKSIGYAVNAIKTFNELFGEYPYPTYSVVKTPFVQGGMEFPALTMIADDIDGMPYGEVIVHETAHQWWQTAVGNNEIEFGFLDEGLAEYSVVLFYEKFPEYGYTREYLIKASEDTYKVFCSVADKVFGNVNTVMVRSLKDFKNEYEYVNIAYVKPCIMYDTARKTVGDARFFTALKRYYSEYKFRNATPHDLVGAFEKTGAGTNGFFQSFFDGKVII